MAFVSRKKSLGISNRAIPPANQSGGDRPAQAQFCCESLRFFNPVRLRLECD